jgi:hypothetical protein
MLSGLKSPLHDFSDNKFYVYMNENLIKLVFRATSALFEAYLPLKEKVLAVFILSWHIEFTFVWGQNPFSLVHRHFSTLFCRFRAPLHKFWHNQFTFVWPKSYKLPISATSAL